MVLQKLSESGETSFNVAFSRSCSDRRIFKTIFKKKIKKKIRPCVGIFHSVLKRKRTDKDTRAETEASSQQPAASQVKSCWHCIRDVNRES